MNNILADLDVWVARGWLSRLNRAFAAFLTELEPACSATVVWAGALASHQLDRGEVFLDLNALLDRPELTLAMPPDEADRSEQQAAQAALNLILPLFQSWQETLPASSLISKGEGNSPMVLDQGRLYLRRYWQYRKAVKTAIDDRLAATRPSLPASIGLQLAELFPPEQTPNWQKIACLLALRAGFTIITGGPGTGKTTTLSKLLALIVGLADQSPPTIVLAAPTGKAAARVSESIGQAIDRLPVAQEIKQLMPKQAVTLHRLLGAKAQSRSFVHDRNNPIVADWIVVDEASMIDLEMMAALLQALPLSSSLILLGDKDQLASVEAGAVLGELCQGAEQAAYDANTLEFIQIHAGETLPGTSLPGTALNQQTVMLRVSHRFSEHSGIGQLAGAVNRGDAEQALAVLENNTDYPELCPKSWPAYARHRQTPTAQSANRILKQLADSGYQQYRQLLDQPPKQAEAYDAWAEKILTAFDQFRILSPLRGGEFGVHAINEKIRQWLFASPEMPIWYVGRPVMVTANNYALGLMNGDIGLTLTDAAGRLRVAFYHNQTDQSPSIRWLSPLRLPQVETAFAITVHKAQGSEFNHTVLVLPERNNPIIGQALIYTAITRAKSEFTLLESSANQVFRKAID